MRLLLHSLGIALFFAASFAANSAESPLEQQIRQTAESFARANTQGYGGTVTIKSTALDGRTALTPCAQQEAFLPPGGKLWGNSTVGVRCVAGAAWTLYIPVNVSVVSDVVVAVQPLAAGQPVKETDVTLQPREVTRERPGMLANMGDAIGKITVAPIAANAVLFQDRLRSPLVIQQGQAVKVVVEGQGFRVSTEGKSMSNATAMQNVQVRMNNGQVIMGTAQPNGTVAVKP